MSKKVAIVYQGAKYPGGIEQYLYGLFSGYDHEKVNLALISLGEWEFSGKIKKLKENIIVIPFKWYRLDLIFRLAGTLWENNFDLVVSQGMVANFYGRLAAFFSMKPALVTIHSNYEYDFAPLKRILYFVSDLFLRPLTKKYITVSKSLKGQLTSTGVSSKKIKVIHNGVKDLGIQEKKREKTITIGTIGRLHFTKGFHNLVHAVSLLGDENVEVLIWGEGKDRESLSDHIKSHGLAEKVKLMGYVDDISKAHKQIDIYTQPSLAEGFGLTVVEAMLAEKPVVVTPRGALTEIIEDGVTGVVAKGTSPEAIAAALRPVIDDEKFARTLAKNARKEALASYGVEAWLEETVNTFVEAAK